ncbi:MAG: alpha/beta fold hydrolase [Nannocystaceae bacterium]|nr:alpha/beta fold hydrolase [Nannocystaceae bacterium]
MLRLQITVAFLSLSCAGADSVAADRVSAAPATVAAPSPVVSRATVVDETAPAERLEVDVDGHPISVWFKTAAEPRDVIVLLHGRTWSARPDFDLQVEGESRSSMDALVAQGFAVYAVDLRGYGATPRDDTGWLTPDRADKDLAEVLRFVGSKHPTLAKPSLLGWSLGSLVAQLTAQRHAELLSSLVLFGYPRDPAQTYTADPPDRTPSRKKTTTKAAAEDFIVRGAISQRGADAFAKAAVAADPVRADWRGSEQWNALKPEAVAVPTLLIHGERDPYAPKEKQAALFRRLGHADRAWVILAGCDHAAHLERCGPRFTHAVVQFIRRPVAQ